MIPSDRAKINSHVSTDLFHVGRHSIYCPSSKWGEIGKWCSRIYITSMVVVGIPNIGITKLSSWRTTNTKEFFPDSRGWEHSYMASSSPKNNCIDGLTYKVAAIYWIITLPCTTRSRIWLHFKPDYVCKWKVCCSSFDRINLSQRILTSTQLDIKIYIVNSSRISTYGSHRILKSLNAMWVYAWGSRYLIHPNRKSGISLLNETWESTFSKWSHQWNAPKSLASCRPSKNQN